MPHSYHLFILDLFKRTLFLSKARVFAYARVAKECPEIAIAPFQIIGYAFLHMRT